MPDPSETLLFLREVESDITAEAQPAAGSPGDFRESVFTRMLADELDSAGILESPVVCHCEGGKSSSLYKASGYSVPDEDSRLDLFVTVYLDSTTYDLPTINGSEIDTAFNKLERFLGRALDGLHTQLELAHDERHMAERIHQLQGKFDRVCFYLFTNARMAVRREKQRKTTVCSIPAVYEVWDIERLRRLRESGASYEALNVDLRSQPDGGLPCVRLDAEEDGFRTCVAIFPGTLLRDLYDEHGSRLLELNVRSYLQAKGKVNKGILETLRKDPSDFMAYNNGITVVAEKVVFNTLRNGREGISELHGMQIVNGGQTTASIHRASKDFEADLSKVFVQGKIVTVDPVRFNDVVPLISRYSNTQNKVTESDLGATHPFHIGLERVSRKEWSPDQTSKWFYERARGSYQTAKTREGFTEARLRDFEKKYPTHQRFTKEDLAKFENCWRALPYIVNRGNQKNFANFMTVLKVELGTLPDTWEPASEDFRRYVAKGILFRDVQQIVKADETITAYRINITAYTASLLADRTAQRINLDEIWRRQHMSDALANTARTWAPVVFKALQDFAQREATHIDNILKSQACWEHIRSIGLKLSPVVEQELISAVEATAGTPEINAIPARNENLTPQDQNNVSRCMQLSPQQWLKIVEWGSGVGGLKKWQCGIATTLASYAAQGWARPPSSKQAKHGAEMVENAKKAGILNA
jgi:hypothetical protein